MVHVWCDARDVGGGEVVKICVMSLLWRLAVLQVFVRTFSEVDTMLLLLRRLRIRKNHV